MLLDIRKSKSGSALIVTDPAGDVHACANAEELHGTITKLMDDPEMPKPETGPIPGPHARAGDGNDPEEVAEALIGEFGARALGGILSGLRNMSHRTAPRRGKPPREAGGSG